MMTADMLSKTIALLVKHEDDKKRAYIDTLGNITCGVGHNLSARDVADDIRERWVKEDIGEFYNDLCSTFSWYLKLNMPRQIALIDLAFMGFKSFLTFEKMLACLSMGDFQGAALNILNSEYHKQVGQRAVDVANIIQSGNL